MASRHARKAPSRVPTKNARRPAVRAAAGEARRQAILTAALDEFSAAGFAAARLDDVARRAGVAKGTIYLYFRDKEALFQELIRAVLGPLITQFEAAAGRDVPVRVMAEEIVALFEREIYATRRKDVIRLIIAEGPRFPQLKRNAAEYWKEQVYATFQDDVPGIRCRDLIGVENLMWGSDYPHFDSTFPKSQEAIERNFEGVPESERELILGENMVRVYNLQSELAPAASQAVGAAA